MDCPKLNMKQKTYNQVEAAKHKAELAAVNLMGDENRAEDFSDMSVEEYAELRGIEIVNPERRAKRMPAKPTLLEQNALLKAALEEAEDRILELETEREEVLDALGIEIINEGEDDDEDEEEEEDDEDEEEDDDKKK